MRIGHAHRSPRSTTERYVRRVRRVGAAGLFLTWVSVSASALASGCGDDTTGGAGGAGGAQTSAGAGHAGSTGMSAATLVGAFNLRLVPATEATSTTTATAAQSAFIGSVADAATPSPMAWIVNQEANGCTLYTPKSPFCDPSCGASAVCVSDDRCVDRPTPQTVGTITLMGVGSSDISMTAIAGNYQPKGGTSLPFPPCTEGSAVTLAATGGTFSAFTLTTHCIAELDFQGPIKLVKGSPLKLTWTAPSQTTLARIQIRIDISHHGGARGKIECDVADSGSVEMPAAMIDKLLDLGVAGFPTVVVTRIASGGVASGEPKQVVLNVQESVEREVQIDGLLSCAGDGDCPAPKTCQTDLTCK